MTILITGANGGLGQGIARYFLEHSSEAFVYLGVRSNRSNAESLKEEFPDRCELVSLDVTEEEAWKNALTEIEARGKSVSVLVNNAGHHEDALLGSMESSVWDGVVESNLKSCFLGCKTVMKGMMMQRFGRMINISSLSALMAPMGQTNYAAAKAGVVAMTQSLAKEVARMGITVNSICPGYIETDALADMDAEQQKGIKKGIPMRRFGQPKEIASAVFFLASEDAAYITGATLKIDGGIF